MGKRPRRSLSSLTKWLWWEHRAQEAPLQDWTQACIFLYTIYICIFCQDYAAEEGLELEFGINRWRMFNLPFFLRDKLSYTHTHTHTHTYTHTHTHTHTHTAVGGWGEEHNLFLFWIWLLPVLCESCHYTKKYIDQVFNHCWNCCLIL